MTRFDDKTSPALYLAMVLSLGAVLLADLATPLGFAVWVIYLIPLVLTFWGWRPELPLVLGAVNTILIVLVFFTDDSGINREIAIVNRSCGLVTIWAMAIIGWLFVRARIAVRTAEWLQTGQTRLSEQLIGEQQLEDLGENAVRFLCNYVNAQAGAIFVKEGEAGLFRRCATFAASAESVPERFALGEGLLGQAAKDARPFVVSEVPEGYLFIGSALGKARPRHLLVAPASVDNSVTAVVELGFFQPVVETDIELLSRVERSIGVAVRSAMYRTRLQELLEETQRQAEELQTQSEELRVSNEELEEQSRALQESKSRLEQQQVELEQVNAQLEEQTQILEAQRDELKDKQHVLEEQARALERASRYKSEFLANMSHELRTPLNSSLILAKLLADNRDGNLTAEQVKYAQTIQSSGQDLLVLINDVLDLSKVEAGRLTLQVEPVRVEQVVESLRRTFGPEAVQKGLALRMGLAPEAPERLETDPQRLEQVLRNLLSNALKFTERGEVGLEVSRAGGGTVAFAVRDTGIGISKDRQEVIFEPFCQADGTTVRKFGGTGLGLSISRELVQLLGGEIQLVSEVGRGSTFTVLLPEVFQAAAGAGRLPPGGQQTRGGPAAAVPLAAAQVAGSEPTSSTLSAGAIPDDRGRLSAGRRVILIVEDDASFARLLAGLAREQRFQCLVATSAEEALGLARQHLPHAVVLDIGLPDQSGLVVLEQLKRDSRTRHIPVHVVSGSDYTEAALAMGAAGYLLKPVQREQIVEALQNLERQFTRKMRRVLVVEDDPVQLESLRLLLGSNEVATVGVRTAAECLEQLKNGTFDCMVLDLTLPDSSGFAILERLSEQDIYSFPPVIIYTGRELTPDEEQRLRRYAKSVIVKGAMSPERLLDEVTLFLHQVVSELPPEQQALLEQVRKRDAVLEGRSILLVEDDVRSIYALSSCLEPRGIKVRIARNGREGLEALERAQSDPGQAVDLVLMDIMMPEMDGLTALREIRKRLEWKKLPIIALTAKAMRQDQQNCLEAGANDYLTKPLDVDKLLSLIRVWMPR